MEADSKIAEEEQEEGSPSYPSNPSNPSSEGLTEVGRWLAEHQLEVYIDVFKEEGYDDLEDLKNVVKEGGRETLEKLVEKAGHRRKLIRLLGEGKEGSVQPSSPHSPPSRGQSISSSHHSASPHGSSCNQELGRYKVIVVGDAGAGKTSYIQQLVHSKFSPNTKATIGLDWREKQFKVAGGFVTVQFWDISGQERFANVTRAYYQGAHGAIVCFDRSTAKSVSTVEKWKEDIDSKVFVGGGTDGNVIPCMLLANKCDLEDKAPIPLPDIAKKHSFEGSFETSAKLNYNILPSIEFLIGAMERHQNSAAPSSPVMTTHVVPIQHGITQHLPTPSESTASPYKNGKSRENPQKSSSRRGKKSCSCG